MNNRKPNKKLGGPWRTVHAVIWMVGIYILASRGWWWPGILILVAISAIYEAVLQQLAPDAFEEEQKEGPMPTGTTREEPAPIMAPALIVEHRLELLPQVCPNCKAPIRGHEVKWTGTQSADCPYCGTNLPMSRA